MSVFYRGTEPKIEFTKNKFNPSKKTLEKIAREANEEQKKLYQKNQEEWRDKYWIIVHEDGADYEKIEVFIDDLLSKEREKAKSEAKKEMEKDLLDWIDKYHPDKCSSVKDIKLFIETL